jgi:hypothetical protein
MAVDDKVYGQMTAGKVAAVIAEQSEVERTSGSR